MMFLVGALFQILFLLGIVIAVIVLLARRSGRDLGAALRHFFLYGMLLTLVILVATGVSGLLAVSDPDVEAGPGYLAFMLSCVIVGGPALFVVVRRVWRGVATEGDTDPSWDVYVIVAELIGLLTAATGAAFLGESLLAGRFDVAPAAVVVVWGAVWFVHHSIAGRRGRSGRLRYGVLLGSVTGLVSTATFGVLFLERILAQLYDAAVGTVVLTESPQAFQQPLVELAIGGIIWVRYWWLLGLHGERNTIWRAYVLLVGVVGGVFTALSGVWTLAFLILDWFGGDPLGPAGSHFGKLPNALALTAIGGIVWRYHSSVLRSGSPTGRTEVDRAHDYTVAGVGLIATLSGSAAVVAAVIQAFLPADLVYPSDRTALMGAVAVLLVGAPIWWYHWTGIQRRRTAEPVVELGSPTRRIYLVSLFGLGGVVALVSLLVLVYNILEPLLDDGLGADTVFSIRWPLALTLTVGVTAAYHRNVRRTDLEEAPEEPEEPAGRNVQSVVLVASSDEGVAEAVRKQTGVEARFWQRSDAEAVLSTEAVIKIIESSEHPHLLIVAQPDGVLVIPYVRGLGSATR